MSRLSDGRRSREKRELREGEQRLGKQLTLVSNEGIAQTGEGNTVFRVASCQHRLSSFSPNVVETLTNDGVVRLCLLQIARLEYRRQPVRWVLAIVDLEHAVSVSAIEASTANVDSPCGTASE